MSYLHPERGVTRKAIRAGIEAIGVAGQVVVVHSRLTSFPWVADTGALSGPGVIIAAFLEAGCTLVVPTYTLRYEIPPLAGSEPERNGRRRVQKDDDRLLDLTRGEYPDRDWLADRDLAYMAMYRHQDKWWAKRTGFARRSWVVDVKSMGILPAEVLRHRPHARGRHLLASFAAAGPRAAEIVARQSPMRPYAHFDRCESVLMMGTPLTNMTLIHYAELRAGRRPFLREAVMDGGKIVRCALGGCSQGFANLEPAVRHLPVHVRVGKSVWRAFPAAETLQAATEAIRSDPRITRCHAERCSACEDAIAGGPVRRRASAARVPSPE